MKIQSLFLFCLSALFLGFTGDQQRSSAVADGGTFDAVQNLVSDIQSHGDAMKNLQELVAIGPRLSGSAGAAAAVEWARKKMETYGFDRVWLQEVRVPAWTRGTEESASIVKGETEMRLSIAALGGSVGTGASDVLAEVVEVHSLEEVSQLGTSAVRGKIVFYNRAMDSATEDKFDAYSDAVDQRQSGAAVAARFGAVASLVRSLSTLEDDDHPHTGTMSYQGGRKIPAAAVSTHGASLLSQQLKLHPKLKLRLHLSAEEHEMATSYNVIGEIMGREMPKEFVVVGGHLDAWDLGAGAQDDGAGVVQSIEVARALKKLALRPKRSVRVVLFMAEEYGGYGGVEYSKQAASKSESHLAAIESDCGGFSPRGFRAPDSAIERLSKWKEFLVLSHADSIRSGFSGTDVEPLDGLGVKTFGLDVDSTHYFDFHHSALDQINIVKESELAQGAAAMASLAYLLAEEGL